VRRAQMNSPPFANIRACVSAEAGVALKIALSSDLWSSNQIFRMDPRPAEGMGRLSSQRHGHPTGTSAPRESAPTSAARAVAST
jgi:hypothetical protein